MLKIIQHIIHARRYANVCRPPAFPDYRRSPCNVAPAARRTTRSRPSRRTSVRFHAARLIAVQVKAVRPDERALVGAQARQRATGWCGRVWPRGRSDDRVLPDRSRTEQPECRSFHRPRCSGARCTQRQRLSEGGAETAARCTSYPKAGSWRPRSSVARGSGSARPCDCSRLLPRIGTSVATGRASC